MVFNIFISYSIKDSETARKLDSYFKQITNTQIFLFESQTLFGQLSVNIIQRIMACDLFIVLYSKNSIQSTYVQQEIGVAKGNNKMIIPILLDVEAKPDALLAGITYLSLYDEQKRNQEMPKLLQYVAENSKKKENLQAVVAVGVIGLLIYALSKE